MKRFSLAVVIPALLCGCGTSPVNVESSRNVVLQYLGGAVGTAGPFGKGGKQELDILNDADRKRAESLIDGGAVMFLVYGASPANPAARSGSANRVVLLQNGRIVGDFAAQPKTGG